jgi:hypothetical protein
VHSEPSASISDLFKKRLPLGAETQLTFSGLAPREQWDELLLLLLLVRCLGGWTLQLRRASVVVRLHELTRSSTCEVGA